MLSTQIRSHFFSSVWLYAAAVFLLLGMISRQPGITILALSVFTISGASWLWARYSLRGVSYNRHLSADRVFRGESITATFRLENRSWLPLARVDIEEHVSDRVKPLDKDIMPSTQVASTLIRHSTPLRWHERVSWSVDLKCPERGSYMLGPVTIRAGDPFGFFTRQVTLDRRQRFLVYPEVLPLGDLGFPEVHPYGDQRVPYYPLTDPSRVVGVRDYYPDDSFRHIHWKATARVQEVQVKVFEPTVTLQLGTFLNLDTFERYWEGMDSTRAESAIVTAASISADALNRRALAGLYANGVITGSDQTLRVPPGRGPKQLIRILEGLARLSPLAATNFPRVLHDQTRRFPWGSTIVVVSSLMTESLEGVLRILVEEGHRVVLVRVGDVRVPPIRKLTVRSVPGRLVEHGQEHRHRYARLVNAGASYADADG
jgi:uncharacterized protein (DUF58 family)